MSSNWDTWVTYFRDSVQNMMLSEEQIKNSPKECITKCAIFCSKSGELFASDQGFTRFKAGDFLKLSKGVGGDQNAFSGISWGTDDNPAGYSIIRLVPHPLNSALYSDLVANILYGRNKEHPEESIFVCNSLLVTIIILFRLKGANKALINNAMSYFAKALASAIDLGI